MVLVQAMRESHVRFPLFQNLEFHLRKLEELSDQTVSHLGVIHRFMATQGRDAPPLHAAFPLASFHVGSAGPGAGPGPGGGGVMGSSQDVQGQGGQGSPSVPEGIRLRRFSDRSDLEGQPGQPGQRMASETSGSATELATLTPLGPPGPSYPRRRPVR